MTLPIIINYKKKNFPNLMQELMNFHNPLLLLHLPTRHTNGKEPLINDLQSHIVTSTKYFNIYIFKNGQGGYKGNQKRKVKGEGTKKD